MYADRDIYDLLELLRGKLPHQANTKYSLSENTNGKPSGDYLNAPTGYRWDS